MALAVVKNDKLTIKFDCGISLVADLEREYMDQCYSVAVAPKRLNGIELRDVMRAIVEAKDINDIVKLALHCEEPMDFYNELTEVI
jgi:hypothetical protein